MNRTVLFAVCASACSMAVAQNAVVQACVNGIDADSLMLNVDKLSGQQAIDVGNGPETLVSRNKFQPGNALAADWLQMKLTEYGYAPTLQAFSATGENVLAVKTGLVHPGRKVVICGHYDSMPGGPVNSPAADDDGSGTVAVLEAARVMAPFQFENTIVFALWDEEEQGKVGSAYYAGASASNDDTLLAAINMDAIAWDGDGDDLMRIHTRPVANSLAIKDSALMVNATYGINIPYAINNPGATYSDHASFWAEGYGSILIIEDFDDDGNPHYHTSTDLPQYIDVPYFRKLAQLAVGTTAVLAVPFDNSAVVWDASLGRTSVHLYPNPAQSAARAWIESATLQRGRITLLDAMGQEVAVVFDGTLGLGSNAFDIELTFLPAGAYTVWLETTNGGTTAVRLVHIP